jgi:2-amino-4-hydroxy-6-hydroxymethyldihydropteridine diphosphokinase
MPEIFVGIGSNIAPERHVRQALDLLAQRFGPLRVSPVYRSRAVGFDGADFLNLVVAFVTDLDVHALDAALDAIEDACGRDRSVPRFAPRTLDLDLLLYGDAVIHEPGLDVPRPEIMEYAFVLKPLAELAGARAHPETGDDFSELWRRFDASTQPLVAVDLAD